MEVLVQFINGNIDVVTEFNREFVAEAVDHKIKEMLFFEFVVCLGWLHTLPKQTIL